MDYLCLQTIGILDNPDEMKKYRSCIKHLESMGVKVILATGVSKEDAMRIAL